MAVRQDRLTVTFYDEEEVEIAQKFRDKLKRLDKTVNDTLKLLVIRYIKE